MKNLETVVRERNKAYYLLETGEDGERPGVIVHSAIGRLLFHSIKYVLSKMLMKELIFIYCTEGLPLYHRKTEHVVQKAANKWWKSNFVHHYNYDECRKFLQLYREKLFKQNRRHRRSDHSCCAYLLNLIHLFERKMRILFCYYCIRLNSRYGRGVLKRFKKIDMASFKEQYPGVKLRKNDQRPDDTINFHS